MGSIRDTECYMIKSHHFIFGIVIFLILVSPWGVDPATAQAPAAPEAYLPETHFEFSTIYKGQKAQHAFVVRNKGTAPLEIIEVRTD